MWLLQHKILSKTWPWTNFVQGQFTPEFQRRWNPSCALQRELLGVNKTGVSLKIHHGASILNAVSDPGWSHSAPSVTPLYLEFNMS